MIAQSDILLAMAQISIAFAGFSGVIAAFSKFRLHPDATRYRVQLMVAAGLSTVLFALLPIVLVHYGLSESTTWRICCGVIGAVGFVFPLIAVRRARELYRAGVLHTQAITVVVNIIGAVITVALLLAAAGVFSGFAAAIYLTALYFTLFLCAYYFFMQMFAIDLGGKG